MNEAIELHDSELAEITCRAGVMMIWLSPAYVHRSAGEPGRDAGTSWAQTAKLIVVEYSSAPLLSGLPLRISSGSLRVGSTVYDNIIPARGRHPGGVELSLVLEQGKTIAVCGEGVRIELQGEARYLEEFTP